MRSAEAVGQVVLARANANAQARGSGRSSKSFTAEAQVGCLSYGGQREVAVALAVE